MLIYDFKKMPSVIMTGKTGEALGWSHSGRSIQYNLLVIFHSGSCVFEINGEALRFGAGDIALVPKNTFYKPITKSGCEYTFFHFDGDFTKSDESNVANQQADPPLYGMVGARDSKLQFDNKMSVGSLAIDIELTLSKCLNAPIKQNQLMPLFLSVHFTELMLLIHKANFSGGTAYKHSSTVGKIVNFIQNNYRDKITLDLISAELGVSKQYCMRVFKASTGKTVTDYVTDMRMKHATYLLRHTYMNVAETADFLGFSSAGYFTRTFKQYYGISPSQYLEN